MSAPVPLSPVVRFGVFEADLRAGELRRNGVKVKLQEQPFQILVMLLERPGAVVTREELRQRLWPADTFVDFDHSLNTAVKKLREALGDDADNPRFVETLPKRGYRFIATVDGWEDKATAAIRTESAAQSRPGSRRLILVTGALLAAVGGAWLVAHRAPSAVPLPSMQLVPLTTLPGEERPAAISPDGKQVAFAWDQGKQVGPNIFLKLVGTETLLPVTTGPEPHTSPVWSPDGRYLAFIRLSKTRGGIFVVPALGGAERKLIGGDFLESWHSGVDWSPDGKFLAFTERGPSRQLQGISLLSLETLEARKITTPMEEGTIDQWPAFSPDAKQLAFVRSKGVDEVYVVPFGGGEARQVTSDRRWVWGLAWTPDGREIVFASNRGEAFRLWRVAASGGTPHLLTVSQENAIFPSSARQGGRLTYTQWSYDTNIWRLEVSHGGKHRTPTPLIASTRRDSGPQFSPDGKKIAFESFRSGHAEIWMCESDGSNPLQLTSFGGAHTGTPRWSPDGRQIVFDSRPAGNGDIFVINVEGGLPRRLTSDSSDELVPSWSRDGKQIYFASNRTGSWQIWVMPPQGGPARQVTRQGGFGALESPDGTLYYSKGVDLPGLWKLSDDAEEVAVLDLPEAQYWGNWAPALGGIYFVDTHARTHSVEFLSFAERRVRRIAELQKPAAAWLPSLALSPNGQWLLYTQVDQQEADIMLVENFR